ncbi:MAG: hypothetical protein FWD19_00645 [Defluviitaleaceae bacterium]|nr:hypothetical protein [Defluviitaleaceae bacterium]
MYMIGTTLVLFGIVGLASKAWDIFREADDPPREVEAKIAKMRLDTKKADGKETYTYIVTFYIGEMNRYISFEILQSQFDEMVEKDCGVLKFNLKRRKFLNFLIAPL